MALPLDPCLPVLNVEPVFAAAGYRYEKVDIDIV